MTSVVLFDWGDTLPCHDLGMPTVLLATAPPAGLPAETRVIGSLAELCRWFWL